MQKKKKASPAMGGLIIEIKVLTFAHGSSD